MNNDIWVFVHAGEHGLDENAGGLVSEARRLADPIHDHNVIAAVIGAEANPGDIEGLCRWGVGRALFFQNDFMVAYQGELFASVLADALITATPRAMLFAHGPQTADLIARLGALLETAAVTRAVDARVEPDGAIRVVRPTANDHLYEELEISGDRPALISFMPSVLTGLRRPCHDQEHDQEMTVQTIPVVKPDAFKTRTLEYIQADPAELDIEEAEIVVAAGRGAAKNGTFEKVQQLAELIGGSMAGTRPVVDRHLLPYERQIGQTGKTVAPRLIINCGISGANEYTAGMERSLQVLAINNDPQAPIFRFADLGVVGDLHDLLPLLVERLKEVLSDDV